MDLVNQTLAILAVLGTLAAALWWLQRRGLAQLAVRPRGKARRMEALERLMLAPNHSLHLVRVAGRVLLIGVSPAGCSMLETIPARELEAAVPPPERAA